MKALAKRSFLRAVHTTAIDSLSRSIKRHRLLVLCYHSVIPCKTDFKKWQVRNAVEVHEFRRQLEFLVKRYAPISEQDLYESLVEDEPLPNNAVLVTFDDGYWNNREFAMPELERYEVPALFFLATNYVGRDKLLWTQELDELVMTWPFEKMPWPSHETTSVPKSPRQREMLAQQLRACCKRLPVAVTELFIKELRARVPHVENDSAVSCLYEFMSWDDVRDLNNRGFGIGSHTATHPILSRANRERIQQEMVQSKFRIEQELNERCRWFAFPNGGKHDVSSTATKCSRETGYVGAFVLRGGRSCAGTDPHRIDRVPISGDLDFLTYRAIVDGVWSAF